MDKIAKIISIGDIKLFHYINNRIKCEILDRIFPYVTNLGSAVVTILTCLIMICFGKNSIKTAGLQSFSSLTFSHLIIHAIKNKFERPRPYIILNNVNTFNIVLKDYSFPSGHTTAAFSICMTLSLLFPNLCVFFLFLALLVGFTRIYLGVHYPTDVIVGMFIGIICSVLINIVFSFLYILN